MSFSDIVLQLIAGVLLADLISGFVHWLEDTYGDPKWPIIGKSIIEPNIIHHDEPLKFTRAPFWKRNRGVIGAMMVFGGLFVLAGWINVMTVTALIFGALANETHRWAHLPANQVPKFVRCLQHVGFFQSAQHHWAHHRNGYNTHYCTITNMVNPTLDGLRVFRVIEGLLEGLLKIRPRNDREDYTHPMMGRRWISRARRVTCVLTRTVRRRVTIGRGMAIA